MRLSVPLFCSAAALVSPGLAAASPPAPALHTCANGLQVLVVENHATPLMTVQIAVHNGAMTEPPDYNGLSHLYEHMFFKGNAAMPDQTAYLARARALGMEFNGTTNNERVNYFFMTTSDHAADSMVFMRDAIVTPLFDPKELERERVVVTGEIDRNESNPFYYLWHEVEKKVFWKYPTRKDALGARATVLAATVDQLRTIQHRYYVPNNSILVVVGDVHADAIFAQADQIYASWARADDPFVKYPVPKHPPIPRSEVVVVPQPVENMSGHVTWQGPSSGDASVVDTYPGYLLTQATRDPSSRFQKDLVDSGLCVRADFSYDIQRYTGDLSLEYEAVPDKIDGCTTAAFAELAKMRAPDYFADEEMANAVHRFEVWYAQQRETAAGLAQILTWAWSSASLDYYSTFLDKERAVTRADFSRYLDTWVLGKPFVFGAMASPKVIAAGLDKSRLERLAGIGGAR
jgi:zinc protease